jgi:hypothetical protein
MNIRFFIFFAYFVYLLGWGASKTRHIENAAHIHKIENAAYT